MITLFPDREREFVVAAKDGDLSALQRCVEKLGKGYVRVKNVLTFI